MQKLTKEQAQWLLEQLKNLPDDYIHRMPDWMDMLTKAKQVINQCTEKEFPEMKWGDEEQRLDVTMGLQIAGVSVDEYKNTIRIAGMMNLSPMQFRQFAEGCNKIVEWLDEKDN